MIDKDTNLKINMEFGAYDLKRPGTTGSDNVKINQKR